MNTLKPKWDITATIYAGTQTYELALKYRSEIENRLKPGEIEDLKSSIAELEVRRSGQKETITVQKSKTKTQYEVSDSLHKSVMDIRKIVKAITGDTGILKAFGVGERVNSKIISDVIAAANMVIEAYAANTEWANAQTGIIEADIELLHTLITTLNDAEGKQEISKFVRKVKTMDKNVIQRKVEDEVTKISALGARIFRTKDPEIVKLFENLIPN